MKTSSEQAVSGSTSSSSTTTTTSPFSNPDKNHDAPKTSFLEKRAASFSTHLEEADAPRPRTNSKVLGSILGVRTASGTMSELNTTGSFDPHADGAVRSTTTPSTSLRERADTAPPALSRSQASTTSTESSSPHKNEAATIDRELQFAQALALAIQKNPHLTPEEAHKLVQAQLQQQQPPPPSSSSVEPLQSAAASLRERAKERFSEIFSSTTLATAGSTTGNTTILEDKPPRSSTVISPVAAAAATTVASSQPRTPSSNSTRPVVDASTGRFFPGRKHPSPRTPPQGSRASTVVSSEDAALLLQSTDHNTNNTGGNHSPPIRLSSIAWKRRGGMGKFSSTGAWERRRIELQGDKLLYYKTEEDNNLEEGGSIVTAASRSLASSMPGEEDAPEGVVVTRRSTWFEHAASNWVAATSSGTEDMTAPRGVLDLRKEKATVNAALGHSGAPSPFALSIKVGGETKWKLCFDDSQTQMEWLAAITDSVIQNSVDRYNASLLSMNDPANQADSLLFQPTAVMEPPMSGATGNPSESGIEAVAGHRLWMVEKYVIRSSLVDSGEAIDEVERLPMTDKVEEEKVVAQIGRDVFAEFLGNATQLWLVPEENLWYALIVLNLSMFVARASSISLEYFWYLVVFANVGAYQCLKKQSTGASIMNLYNDSVEKVEEEIKEEMRNKNSGLKTGPESSNNNPSSSNQNPSSNFRPVAGTTTVKIKEVKDPPVNSKGQIFAGWRNPPGETLMVRSQGYKATKAKIPSPGELYELHYCDIFESPHTYPDMAPRVKLPKMNPDNVSGPDKTWRAPDLFVISIALPTDPPSMSGGSRSDGGGYTITMYFTMKKETREILRRVTADGYDPSSEKVDDPQKSQVNAVRLLEEWIRRAPNDPKWFSRFKVVPNAHNLKEIGMPGWISSYNGKPFLIKRPGVTGFLHQHPELSCLEFDISLHPFPFLAKKGICFMKDRFFKKVLVTFGFVIEGKTDDELPECLIGAMQLCYPDPMHAIQAADFFAGRSPNATE